MRKKQDGKPKKFWGKKAILQNGKTLDVGNQSNASYSSLHKKLTDKRRKRRN